MYLNVGHGGGTGDTHDKDGINMAKTQCPEHSASRGR